MGNALLYISLLSVALIASFTSSAILNNLFAICNSRLLPTNQIVNCDGRVRPIQGRTLFLFLWKLMLFHHLLQDVCHIILVDAGSFIVLHVCVLSALRHSYRGLSCFLMIRSRTFFDGSKEFILFSKEYKKNRTFLLSEKSSVFATRSALCTF